MKTNQIPLFKVFMPKSVDKPLLKTLHSGYITEGPKVKEFEKALRDYFRTNTVLTVNSGTSALTLALRLAGVRPGDEVITTAMTCSATNEPILALGATPVFADVDYAGLIRTGEIRRLITNRTRAVMVVDWGGTPCNLAPIMKLAKERNLKVIEDAAHAIGARYNSGRVGKFADFTCFSLQAIKHITTVDGGLLICRNVHDYRKAKRLRWFGIDREAPAKDTRIDQDISDWGYKFHMNDVAATIGLAQLPHLEKILRKHRINAKYYDANLPESYRGVHLWIDYDYVSSFWLYTIKLPEPGLQEKFKEFMGKRGIQVSQVHRRNDTYSVFRPFERYDLPALNDFASRMICIPVHWGLSRADRERIVNVVKLFEKYRLEGKL